MELAKKFVKTAKNQKAILIGEKRKMEIIKEKQYDLDKVRYKLARVTYTSNGTLCFITEDGTHYNFNKEELRMIIDFINQLDI